MTTSLTDIGTLRRAAVDMITEAWAALAAEHVVPCSRYRPYVQVGRDYEGGALSGRPAFTQFSDTLRQAYPAWFDAPQGQFPRRCPDVLAFQFVDATIAELTRCGETGDAPDHAVQVTLLHLIDYLDREDSRVACAQDRTCPISMTDDRQELTIAGVTILAYQQFEETRADRRGHTNSGFGIQRRAATIVRAAGGHPG